MRHWPFSVRFLDLALTSLWRGIGRSPWNRCPDAPLRSGYVLTADDDVNFIVKEPYGQDTGTVYCSGHCFVANWEIRRD
jgi:hypothetical protein